MPISRVSMKDNFRLWRWYDLQGSPRPAVSGARRIPRNVVLAIFIGTADEKKRRIFQIFILQFSSLSPEMKKNLLEIRV